MTSPEDGGPRRSPPFRIQTAGEMLQSNGGKRRSPPARRSAPPPVLPPRTVALREVDVSRLLLPALLCALVPSPCAAQAFVERLDPPVLARGKTTRLTAVGSRLGNAHDVWSSLPKGKLTAKVVEGA